jgi:hypothetical protein
MEASLTPSGRGATLMDIRISNCIAMRTIDKCAGIHSHSDSIRKIE